jgi:hypothetical protein
MGFEHLRTFCAYTRSNLVEPSEQVVGAVVRKRGSRETQYSGGPIRDAGASVSLVVPRSRRDQHVIDAELA